jgi:hypothetical protein
MLAYEIGGFIRKITTFPDLEVVFGMEELLQDMGRELQLHEPGQIMSYNTTFQLGDFYLSFVLYRAMIFQEEPCIPALFLIHERKFAETHCTFFKELKKVVPSKCTVAIVTDRERANTTAISTEVPTVLQQFCWNHILQDVRRWLTAHGAPRTDISAMIGNLRILFNQPNLMEYERTLGELSSSWDVLFQEYYFKFIHPDVNKGVGRWRLEGAGVHTRSGVTTNLSESLNRVIKSLQNWKEAPADVMITALYQLQQFHINEIQRGLAG